MVSVVAGDEGIVVGDRIHSMENDLFWRDMHVEVVVNVQGCILGIVEFF
jgi:hypothetical protein